LPVVGWGLASVLSAADTDAAAALPQLLGAEQLWPQQPGPAHWQPGPDFQYIGHPGYHAERGPVRFRVVGLHLEY
jgi:hypothetical protein